MIRKVSAEDIAIRGNGTGLEYMCPTRHFVYIFFNPVFQVSTAKNEINLFNNQVLIVAPVTFAPAGAMTPSAEFLSSLVAFVALYTMSYPFLALVLFPIPILMYLLAFRHPLLHANLQTMFGAKFKFPAEFTFAQKKE